MEDLIFKTPGPHEDIKTVKYMEYTMYIVCKNRNKDL